jgi:hypothetical protein
MYFKLKQNFFHSLAGKEIETEMVNHIPCLEYGYYILGTMTLHSLTYAGVLL